MKKDCVDRSEIAYFPMEKTLFFKVNEYLHKAQQDNWKL